MSRWFRFYDTAVDDPKVQRLPGDLFKTWINLLCLASRNEGVLPNLADAAFSLRLSEKETEKRLETLISAGLVDRCDEALRPHNWNSRQFKSDSPNERVKRFRERVSKRDCNVTETVNATGPETETETETERACVSRAREANPESDLRQDIVLVFQKFGSITIPDTSRAAVWLDRGWRPVVILAVISEILGRDASISSLSYFEKPIANAHLTPVGQPRAPPAARQSAPSSIATATRNIRNDIARRNRESSAGHPSGEGFSGPVIDG